MVYSYRVFLLLVILLFFTAISFAKYGGGIGDPNDPYQIITVDHLFEMRDNSADWCKCFIMMEDIDLNGYEFSKAIISPNLSSFQQYYVGIPFTGTFNGNHKVIKNMNIKGNNYLGLFGKIENCVIKNLIIIESSVHAVEGSRNCGGVTGMNDRGKIIHCSFSGDIVGYWNVSGICGTNLCGFIMDCYSEGSVCVCDTQYDVENALGGLVGNNSEGCILRCNSTCSVSGKNAVGGLVGINYKGVVSSCYATGPVDGWSDTGGLIGINDEGQTSYCYYNGSVSGTGTGIGGCIGLHDNESIVHNCFARGSVIGLQKVGALIGYSHLSDTFNCYSTGQALAKGTNKYYGLIGDSCAFSSVADSFWEIYSDNIVSCGGIGKPQEQMQNIGTFLVAGWDFLEENINGISSIWCMNQRDGYPTLAALHGFPPNPLSGEGTDNDPYQIYDANDLATVWYRPEASYHLKNNVDLSGISWNASIVSEYLGSTFDGNHYKILNMNIENSKCNALALFAYIHQNSKIVNLCIENCTIKGENTAGLAMINHGNIENCCVVGNLHANKAGGLIGSNIKGMIHNCHTSVNIEIYTGAAGLICYDVDGLINDCSSKGLITNPDSKASGIMGGLIAYSKGGEINNSHSTIEIEGTNWSNNIGGLVGTSEKCRIHNCFAIGRVKGKNSVGGLIGRSNYSSVRDSYSIGNVHGSYYVGGLIGSAESGTIITDCYAHGNISSSGTAGGLVGRSSGGINNCFSIGSVEGSTLVGGLIGWNDGSIVNSYSKGNVNALGRSGGFVGTNSGTLVQNCYSTGILFTTSFSGVGGFIGENRKNRVSNCFWNIQDNNQYAGIGDDIVDSVYGKSKSEMRSKITYLDSGWDFMNEDNNGTEDIWYIPEGKNYPRLWWQDNNIPVAIAGQKQLLYADINEMVEVRLDGSGSYDLDEDLIDYYWYNDANELIATGAEPNVMLPVGEHVIDLIVNDGLEDSVPNSCVITIIETIKVPVKLTPRTLNCRSKRKWVKAHFILPKQYTIEDIDTNRPAVVHSFGIESTAVKVSANGQDHVKITASFDRQEFCSLVNDWPEVLRVYGFFNDGSIFYGESVIRINPAGLKEISELATYWLGECDNPNWCDGLDLNRDMTVNLQDYSLLLNSDVEFTEE